MTTDFILCWSRHQRRSQRNHKLGLGMLYWGCVEGRGAGIRRGWQASQTCGSSTQPRLNCGHASHRCSIRKSKTEREWVLERSLKGLWNLSEVRKGSQQMESGKWRRKMRSSQSQKIKGEDCSRNRQIGVGKSAEKRREG